MSEIATIRKGLGAHWRGLGSLLDPPAGNCRQLGFHVPISRTDRLGRDAPPGYGRVLRGLARAKRAKRRDGVSEALAEAYLLTPP
jgi:hypothetical protein